MGTFPQPLDYPKITTKREKNTVKLNNWKFITLAICAVIITVVACAQKKKPNLTPTKEQAAMLAAAQADLRVAADQLLQVQQTYNQAASKASWVCSTIIKTNIFSEVRPKTQEEIEAAGGEAALGWI